MLIVMPLSTSPKERGDYIFVDLEDGKYYIFEVNYNKDFEEEHT